VNARETKNLPGRKSDVQESQWLMKLHTYGLIRNSFRPSQEIRTMRTYWRQRNDLVRSAGRHIQRMQKALTQMNIQLANVLLRLLVEDRFPRVWVPSGENRTFDNCGGIATAYCCAICWSRQRRSQVRSQPEWRSKFFHPAMQRGRLRPAGACSNVTVSCALESLVSGRDFQSCRKRLLMVQTARLKGVP
jgi:hypothetical protein